MYYNYEKTNRIKWGRHECRKWNNDIPRYGWPLGTI